MTKLDTMTPAEFKAARLALGLTPRGLPQRQLAAILGMDESHIRRMEMSPKRASHRPVMGVTELAMRYMLRDLREGRWHGEPEV